MGDSSGTAEATDDSPLFAETVRAVAEQQMHAVPLYAMVIYALSPPAGSDGPIGPSSLVPPFSLSLIPPSVPAPTSPVSTPNAPTP